MSAQCWITNIYQQRTSSKSHIYTRVVRDAKPNESKAWNSKRRQWELSAILGTVGDNIMRLPFGSPCDTWCLWFTRPTAPTRNPQRHSCDSITSDRRKVRKAYPRWLPQSLFSSSSSRWPFIIQSIWTGSSSQAELACCPLGSLELQEAHRGSGKVVALYDLQICPREMGVLVPQQDWCHVSQVKQSTSDK